MSLEIPVAMDADVILSGSSSFCAAAAADSKKRQAEKQKARLVYPAWQLLSNPAHITISCICSHLASISATSFNCVLHDPDYDFPYEF